MTTPHSAPNLLSTQLGKLFATVTSTTGRPYSHQEVADAINAKAGRALLSRSYISLLLAGKRTNISAAKLTAIADFFGCTEEYLTGQNGDIDPSGDYRAKQSLRRPAIRDLAAVASDLPDSDVEVLLGLARHLSTCRRAAAAAAEEAARPTS